MCKFCLLVKYWYQKPHHYYSLLPGILLKNQTIYSQTWQCKCSVCFIVIPSHQGTGAPWRQKQCRAKTTASETFGMIFAPTFCSLLCSKEHGLQSLSKKSFYCFFLSGFRWQSLFYMLYFVSGDLKPFATMKL